MENVGGFSANSIKRCFHTYQLSAESSPILSATSLPHLCIINSKQSKTTDKNHLKTIFLKQPLENMSSKNHLKTNNKTN
jgi:hypothetical protein